MFKVMAYGYQCDMAHKQRYEEATADAGYFHFSITIFKKAAYIIAKIMPPNVKVYFYTTRFSLWYRQKTENYYDFRVEKAYLPWYNIF